MKRKIVLAWLILSALLAFVPTHAESAPTEDDFYREQFELSGADRLQDALPEKTESFFAENGLDPSDSSWVGALSAENVFQHILTFIRSGARTPLAAGTGILGILLITAVLTACQEKNSASKAAQYACTLACAGVILAPVYSVITAAVDAMQESCVFMSALLPVFAAVLSASGAVLTSASASTLLLAAIQVVSALCSYVVLPLMGGYLAVSISASVSPLIQQSGIGGMIKKLSMWIMSLITTVFIGILGIQTAVNASADTLSLKTAKFIVGSAVPVAGPALSEALTTVTASMSLLRSSVGIYGVVACCVILLPLVLELLLWRLVLTVTACISELFSLSEISGLLKAVDAMISVLVGIILLTGALFVISLTLVVSAGKG